MLQPEFPNSSAEIYDFNTLIFTPIHGRKGLQILRQTLSLPEKNHILFIFIYLFLFFAYFF